MTKIVQCPSCNTKFALNESQLAGIEKPKFQCSRCQTIFNLTVEKAEEDTEIKIDKGSPEPPLENVSRKDLSGEWDLGGNLDSSDQANATKEDPYLQDFSIDTGRFSFGIEKSTSIAHPSNDPADGTQLDFEFNNPKISHGPQSSSNQRDTPTKLNNRIDIGTLDNVIYGESGQKDSSISLDWDTDGTRESNTSDFRKVREGIGTEHKILDDATELSNLFRSGSQRSSTGTHYYKNSTDLGLDTEPKSDDTPSSSSSPSWSELKEKIEKKDEETDSQSSYSIIPTKHDFADKKLSDFSSVDSMNFPFQDPAEGGESHNRSMKNTTVLKREALDVEGFLKPIDDDDENYSEISSPSKTNRSSFNFNSYLRVAMSKVQSLLKKPQKIKPFTKSLLIAWSVPVLFIALLFIWGQRLSNKQNLNSIETAFADTVALFTPPELLLPPATLVVNNLLAELRPDKSGEPMIVISGDIFNAGRQTVLNATIEARTFDINNALTKSIQAPVPNELSRYATSVKLTEITKKEIFGLQSKRSWDGIAPSKKIPFKVVVTDIGMGYRYFSAKIYSVSEIS